MHRRIKGLGIAVQSRMCLMPTPHSATSRGLCCTTLTPLKLRVEPAGAIEAAAAQGQSRHQHLIVELALKLLLRAHKRGMIDRSPQMLGMLDGLLPLLARALRSRHGSIVRDGLRVFALLAPLPLPGESSYRQAAAHPLHLLCLRVLPDCVAQEMRCLSINTACLVVFL